MDITPVTPKGRQIINRYGNGGFVIDEIAHKGNVLVLADETMPWPITDMAMVSVDSLQPVFRHDPMPELLLIGTGKLFMPVAPQLLASLRSRGIAVDAMDTGAACRTYNVLLAEDRRVAAALIAV